MSTSTVLPPPGQAFNFAIPGGGIPGQGLFSGAMTNVMSMLSALESSYPGIYDLLYNFASVAGMILVMSTIFSMRGQSLQGQQKPLAAHFWTAGVGIALIALPVAISSVAATIFGNESALDSMGYQVAYLRHSENTLSPVWHFVMLIGLIAVIRGFFILRRVGSGISRGDEGYAKAGTHIFFGAACIHVQDSLLLLAKTFGLNVGSALL